ncbi:MAG: peptidoglycan-binding domain-containing protein, partial [bacterium]
MKRNRLLGLALAGVVGSGAIGWVAGTQVQSSNEASAAAKPPAASAVTAAVKRQALAATIVTRGTAQYGEPTKVNLAASAGGELVTRSPEAEKDLNEGGAFMEANGHPVFALQGDRPMYRDLRPGETGEDVRQLEEALARLGFDPGVVDGVYDGATASAVDRWYTAAGYSAQGPTEAERSELRSAANGVDQAQSALAAARRQLADGTKPPTEVEL